MSETNSVPSEKPDWLTNPFPRFIFAFNVGDEFVNRLMDIAPEALWLDTFEHLEPIEKELGIPLKTLPQALRASHGDNWVGQFLLTTYRGPGFQGDKNQDQVIITGPLQPQDVFCFSRVYGVGSCLLLQSPSIEQIVVGEPYANEFKLHTLFRLPIGDIQRQLDFIVLEWGKLRDQS